MDIKDIAKEIRVILANSFHKTKFSVKISRFSQGSSVDITWTDGPTESQVNELVGHFGDTRSRFVETTRLYSSRFINTVIAKWKTIHPSHSDLTLNCSVSGLSCFAEFNITEFANNPDLPLYEQSLYELTRHSVLEGTEIKIIGELISNEELVKLNELAESEPESNLVQFKKPVPSSTPTPAQNPQSSEDVSFIQIYEAWVKKLITQGELNKIKSFDDWYAIASQVL